jgi:hypothetical protein
MKLNNFFTSLLIIFIVFFITACNLKKEDESNNNSNNSMLNTDLIINENDNKINEYKQEAGDILFTIEDILSQPKQYLNKKFNLSATLKIIDKKFYLENNTYQIEVNPWLPIYVAQCPPGMDCEDKSASIYHYINKKLDLMVELEERDEKEYINQQWVSAGVEYIINVLHVNIIPYGEIKIMNQEVSLPYQNCVIDSQLSFPSDYSPAILIISFKSDKSSQKRVSFDFIDKDNDVNNIFYNSPYNNFDSNGKATFSNNLTQTSYSIWLDNQKLELIWENIQLNEKNKYIGEGQLLIKDEIGQQLGNSYYYLPPQTIYFKCQIDNFDMYVLD